jgi:hypothetical protein
MGPLATQVLADQGADVILVEAPGGDTNRVMGPGPHPELSGIALNLLRNKRSISIDLKSEAGMAFIRAVVPHCDVVVSTMRPHVLVRLASRTAAWSPCQSSRRMTSVTPSWSRQERIRLRMVSGVPMRLAWTLCAHPHFTDLMTDDDVLILGDYIKSLAKATVQEGISRDTAAERWLALANVTINDAIREGRATRYSNGALQDDVRAPGDVGDHRQSTRASVLSSAGVLQGVPSIG